MKKRKKYYIVCPEKGRFFYGCFPRSKIGKIAAKKYLKQLSLTNKTKLVIK